MTCFSRTLLAIVVLAVLAPVGASAARKPKPDFQIKFATLAPDGSAWMKAMHAIDDELRARTGNRLGFKFYPGGVQGDEKDVLRKMRIGQIHAGGFTGNGLGAVVPEVRVLELPFMFHNLDELDRLREKTNDYFFNDFEEQGYINLGWVDVGFVYVLSKEQIHTPEDMQKAKVWVWSGDPLAEIFFKAFDVTPIPLAAPDVLTSLQTGIIDTVYGPPLAVMAMQWYTRVDYMTDVPVTHGIGAVLVSKRALSKVSPEDIETLKAVARPMLRDLTKKTRTQNQEAIEELKKEGIEIIEVSGDVRRDFFKRGRSAWGDGVGELYSQELLDRMTSILEQMRNTP